MTEGNGRFPGLFFRQVARYQDRVALRHKDYGIWKRISWKEYGEMVRIVAAGLISLGVSGGIRFPSWERIVLNGSSVIWGI